MCSFCRLKSLKSCSWSLSWYHLACRPRPSRGSWRSCIHAAALEKIRELSLTPPPPYLRILYLYCLSAALSIMSRRIFRFSWGVPHTPFRKVTGGLFFLITVMTAISHQLGTQPWDSLDFPNLATSYIPTTYIIETCRPRSCIDKHVPPLTSPMVLHFSKSRSSCPPPLLSYFLGDFSFVFSWLMMSTYLPFQVKV